MEKKRSKWDKLLARYRILRGFSKKRVDYSSVIKEFYIEDGLAYIACNVHSYEEVIDRYSVKGYEWPNRELLQYIEDNAYYIPSEYPIVVELSGVHFTEEQKRTIEKTLTDYYVLKLGDTQLDVDDNLLKELILFGGTILSAVGLVIYWMFTQQENLLQETLLLLFWFFLWEWGDVVIFDRREVHMKRNDTAQLSSMKLIFSDRFIDQPLDEETKEEIIEEIIANGIQDLG